MMKTFLVSMAVAVVLALSFPGDSFARRVKRVVFAARYVSGEVLSVHRVAYGRGTYYGVHLLLRTPAGPLPVYLGPSWFLNSRRMKVAPRDIIEVRGRRVVHEGETALIAAEICKGNSSLRLRTAGGLPLWRRSAAHPAGSVHS